MRVLVTGGAGYIGSHVSHELVSRGHAVTVIDDLSGGYARSLPDCHFVQASLADEAALEALFKQDFDAVMHFAGSIVVPESVTDPLKYYANNTRNSLNLLRACARAGVSRFVFSSTAAVYGLPDQVPVNEDAPLAPITPYGASKLMVERMLADYARSVSHLRYVSLRYFNVAGAHPGGGIGESHEPETHLIPLALQVASGRRDRFVLYGDDYDTPDGTCIRDYIHVSDLATAHVAALDYLAEGGACAELNCGYGYGYSVREVLNTVRRVTDYELAVEVAPKRAGDPAELVADTNRLRGLLEWKPRFADLSYIVETAWRWEQRLLAQNAANQVNNRRGGDPS